MDLDEYLFYKKKNNPEFTHQQFAHEAGIGLVTLYSVLSGDKVARSETAYKIDKYTNGQVSGWELITKAVERKMKGKK
jgi:predicted transcriptional regulator